MANVLRQHREKQQQQQQQRLAIDEPSESSFEDG
eukprot:CAMPEP_0119556698 /NCGR_PEP_ID=MMETSP1352-20130426/8574_1 /TAXON_ID=265584 /ORGANISM="Stauroneis constricta, Strain CCMP1120" /LENGTH=33 /DNA_ID= /DNA_START= /DNA_END= /DNA_ORIENTATION=